MPVLVEDNLVSNDLSRTTDPTRVLVPIRYPVPAHVVRPIKSLTLSNAEKGSSGSICQRFSTYHSSQSGCGR